jgi:hypothetical protein
MENTIMTSWGHVAARAALVGVAAWLVTAVTGGVLLSGTSLAGPTGAPAWQTVLLSVLALQLVVAALVYPAVRSSRRGTALAVALFLAILGIHVLLVWVEAFVARLVPPSEMGRALVGDVLVAATIAFLLARAIDTGRSSATPVAAAHAGDARSWSAWGWTWRMALCAFCYLVLYFIAGLLIWPAIRPFYESRGLEVNAAIILPLQILRGAAYVLFTLPLLRSLEVTRWQASLAMAIMFPLLAGVAALIIPNPIFPDWVRAYHLGEIAWSNFVYGALVGAVFWSSPRAAAAAEDAAARTGSAARSRPA